MTFGIGQLWTLLALGGAAQLYLLWQMLKGTGFRSPRAGPGTVAVEQPVVGQPASPAPAGLPAPSAFGKRTTPR